jgi:hypothetical protein
VVTPFLGAKKLHEKLWESPQKKAVTVLEREMQ